MWPNTGVATACPSVGTLPSQKYGAVLARSHRAGGSRGPLKSDGGVGTGSGSRLFTAVSWTIVPSFGLAAPAAWQGWDVSPLSNNPRALENFRACAARAASGAWDVLVLTALRTCLSSPLANFTSPWFMSTNAARFGVLSRDMAATAKPARTIAATASTRRIGFRVMNPPVRAWQPAPPSARRRRD